MTETPAPPSGAPEGGDQPASPPPPPPNPYGGQPAQPPAAPPNPYSSTPPPPPAGETPYAQPPTAQTPYGATPYPSTPYPTSPPPMAAQTKPSIVERFLARFVDGVIVAVVEVILYVTLGSVASSLIGTLLYVAYFTYLESSRGQTIGKRLLKLRVVGASGGNPTTQEALTRNAWALLNLLGFIPVVGFLVALALLAGAIAIAVTASQDPQGRGWHDKLAGTTVVKG